MKFPTQGLYRQISLGVILSILLSMVNLTPTNAALSDSPTLWTNFNWAAYTYRGQIISDHESSSDPSNGGAAVQPKSIDVASCSPDAVGDPGVQESAYISFYDGGTAYDGNPASTTHLDDYVGFRMRLDDDPRDSGANGFDQYHWNFLIDIDDDGYKEFVVDVDGNASGSGVDGVWLLYNNNDTQIVSASSTADRKKFKINGDELDVWYAGDGSADSHTRVIEDTSVSCTGDNDFWLDVQIPLQAFDDAGGNQLILPDTPVRLFYSTSASNTDPLQKDWMHDPDNQTGGYTSGDPVTFGDTYSGDGGVEPLPDPPSISKNFSPDPIGA